jgi:hypothetical protein
VQFDCGRAKASIQEWGKRAKGKNLTAFALGPKKLLDLEIVLHTRRTAIDGTSDTINPSKPAVNPTFTAETQSQCRSEEVPGAAAAADLAAVEVGRNTISVSEQVKR